MKRIAFHAVVLGCLFGLSAHAAGIGEAVKPMEIAPLKIEEAPAIGVEGAPTSGVPARQGLSLGRLNPAIKPGAPAPSTFSANNGPMKCSYQERGLTGANSLEQAGIPNHMTAAEIQKLYEQKAVNDGHCATGDGIDGLSPQSKEIAFEIAREEEAACDVGGSMTTDKSRWNECLYTAVERVKKVSHSVAVSIGDHVCAACGFLACVVNPSAQAAAQGTN